MLGEKGLIEKRGTLQERGTGAALCIPGTQVGDSSHLDSGTSVANSCPLCFKVPAAAPPHLFLLNKLPFPSTHFLKPRTPQIRSTDLLKFRLAFPEENFPS